MSASDTAAAAESHASPPSQDVDFEIVPRKGLILVAVVGVLLVAAIA